MFINNGQPQRKGWVEEDRITVTWLLPAPAKVNLRPGMGKIGHVRRARPRPAVHGQSPRFGAASALLPFVRLAAFSEDEGPQPGLSGS